MSYLNKNISRLNAINFENTVADNLLYIFASSVNNTASDSSILSMQKFCDSILFGKKIDENEVFNMIKNARWLTGNTYDQVDHRIDSDKLNYYIVVYPEDEYLGDYGLFTCVFNNYGAQSTEKPVYLPETPKQLYYTLDGYIWKFKAIISGPEFQKYSIGEYIPLVEPVLPAVYDEQISNIFVENNIENYGYVEKNGTLVTISNVGGTKQYYVDNVFEEFDNYYATQSLYITSASGVSKLYEIISYKLDAVLNKYYFTIDDPDIADFIKVGASAKIVPRIEIIGSGSGATAIPIMTAGSITSIRMISHGSGYKRASARVISPLYGFITTGSEKTGNEAIITPCLTPIYTSLADEFNVTSKLIYNTNTVTDNSYIPTSNTYSKLGLVLNPEFVGAAPNRFDNRLKITVNSTVGVSVGELLTQIKDGNTIFEGYVHEKTATELWLYDYSNYYKNYMSSDTALDVTRTIRTSTGIILTIEVDAFTGPEIEYSEYIQRTGKLLYINTFNKIERTETSEEKYKILLNF